MNSYIIDVDTTAQKTFYSLMYSNQLINLPQSAILQYIFHSIAKIYKDENTIVV